MVDDSSLTGGDRLSVPPVSGPKSSGNAGGPETAVTAPGAAVLTPARVLLIVGGLATLAAVAVIAVALVSGGGSSAAPAPSPTATSSPPVTSSPEPVEAALLRPTSLFDVVCDELVPSDLAFTVLGEQAVLVADSEPWDWTSAALLSTGGLDCVWGLTSSAAAVAATDPLSVAVLPGAAADPDSLFRYDGGSAVINTAGDASVFSCAGYRGGPGCFGGMHVRGAWVEAGFSVAGAPDSAELNSRMQAVLDSVERALRSAEPATNAWVPSDDEIGPLLCVDGEVGEQLQAAFDEELVTYGSDAGGAHGFALWRELDAAWCLTGGTTFDEDSRVVVSAKALPGGAWSAHGAAEVWPRMGSVSAVEVAGAERARISCADSTCRTVVQVGENAYWFETKRLDRDDVIASLGRLFEAFDDGAASAG
ncbi:MAG TPA: hypothetical protein DEB55_05065 [Microbacterium sp.]|uniref:hypothetical protein n=1 Tax=Microbacterium sp. UBA1612 TaxID=1946942 RepID=UPI000E8A69F0|nr:hypothetical protein [Microbacterium sp. UBA1612]HBS73744.1 hypothetical protein [Microbacterium sp.]|tara:strand:+ start:5997 stop:7259 length:1263 start_codon:yes stop_codon:yes gene_type:complete